MDGIKQVLYLSYDGLTDPLGQSQILPYIIGLSGRGYSFTIISFEKENTFQQQGQAIDLVCGNNKITWIPLKYHKSPPVISTLYDLWLLRKRTYEIIRKNKISILHCRSYVTSLVALGTKKRWNIKFIFDMRGFWADERVEGGLWKLKKPIYQFIYKYFKKKELRFLSESDYIISLTQNAKREIESWGIKTPIAVIPTCVDLELFDPAKILLEEITELKVELGIEQNHFVLLYLGSWGTWYLTEEMMNFFSTIRKFVKAKFLIVTRDQVDLTSYEYAEDVIVKSVLRNHVPKFIAIASAGIAFIKPSFSKKASSATKIAELLAMDVPVYVNTGWGDVDELFSEYPQWKVDLTLPFDKQVNTEKRNTINDFRKLAMRAFNLQAAIEQYLSVYNQLIKR